MKPKPLTTVTFDPHISLRTYAASAVGVGPLIAAFKERIAELEPGRNQALHAALSRAIEGDTGEAFRENEARNSVLATELYALRAVLAALEEHERSNAP